MKKKSLVLIILIGLTLTLTACTESDSNESSTKEPKTESKSVTKGAMKKYLKSFTDLDLQVDNLGDATFNITNSGVTPKEAVGFLGESDTKMAIYILNSGDDTTKLSDYFLDRDYKVYYDDMYKYVLVSRYEMPDSWFDKYQEAIATS